MNNLYKNRMYSGKRTNSDQLVRLVELLAAKRVQVKKKSAKKTPGVQMHISKLMLLCLSNV